MKLRSEGQAKGTMSDLFFDYTLPPHLIAQQPAERRDGSRLMVLDRAADSISHHTFADLPRFLLPNDLLVLNDTRVIPARVEGVRANTGGRWEGLFVRETPAGEWELLCHTRGFAQPGEMFTLSPTGMQLTLTGRTDDRHWLMRPDRPGSPAELLADHGHMPLPHYIRKGHDEPADRHRYQTVYADRAGSVAAPTAGLHFTPELLQGLSVARVTLHVGLGTFAPIKADDPTQHQLHAEWAEVPADTVAAVKKTEAAGGRVIAVGTTSTRTLEAAAQGGELAPFRGETALYIHPPYRFRVVDGLITNFHLPKTTLLLLVGALSGTELLRRAYAEAVRAEYRFFSYGDAMLVV
jgi:S-adenosylmethionine:tRNA ribosyltransferase-isomerase